VITTALAGPTSATSRNNSTRAIAVHTAPSVASDASTRAVGSTLGQVSAANGE
jgi:hypothetical protein